MYTSSDAILSDAIMCGNFYAEFVLKDRIALSFYDKIVNEVTSNNLRIAFL